MGPQRIVCLTEETTEWLYLLGEQDRIVGISGYTVRPPQARRAKPRVSAFLDGKIDRIVALECEGGNRAQNASYNTRGQNPQFLSNFGIDILGPVDDFVFFKKGEHRPDCSQHRGIRHSHDEIRTRQK